MAKAPSEEMRRIGHLAVELKLATEEEVASAQAALIEAFARGETPSLADVLREQGTLTGEAAERLLAEYRLHTSETDRIQPWIIPPEEGAEDAPAEAPAAPPVEPPELGAAHVDDLSLEPATGSVSDEAVAAAVAAAPKPIDPDATSGVEEGSSPELISPEEAAKLFANALVKKRAPEPPADAPVRTAVTGGGVPGLRDAIPIKGYEILDQVSQDETGMLYRAKQVAMDRLVLIKMLRPEHTGDKSFVERFLREARMAGQFNHPNLVRVHEVGRAGVHYFYSMEHVEGRTLEAAVRQAGALQPRRACEIVRDLAGALDQWEKRKLVHGEVRPNTITLTEDGVPKLSGLGLSARNEKAALLAGTGVHFAAPELALGEAFDSRADIYSLGGVLFFILTGKAPHPGSTAKEVLASARRGPPDLKSYFTQIPKPIGAIVTRAMQPHQERRYSGFEAFLAALDEILLRGTSMGAPLGPRPVPRMKTRKIRRRR